MAGQSIGERIREAREAAKVSQVDLAEAAGVRPHTMWRYEANKIRNPKPEILERVARRLGVDLTWLTTGKVAGDSHVETEHVDSAAWLELVESGRLDAYRRRGLSERQIQAARRTYFRGTPTVRDYERHLDAYLLDPVEQEPEQMRHAREEHQADPGLVDMLPEADEP